MLKAHCQIHGRKGASGYSLTVPTGDYDNDRVIDAADYAIWQGTIGSTTDLRADGDNDGVIGPGDYNTWAAKFGTIYSGGAGATASAAVPEPASIWLLLTGIGAIVLCCAARETRN